ncbi:hypothetical protein NFI96_016497, partial [Prochilodus magdalenae]
ALKGEPFPQADLFSKHESKRKQTATGAVHSAGRSAYMRLEHHQPCRVKVRQFALTKRSADQSNSPALASGTSGWQTPWHRTTELCSLLQGFLLSLRVCVDAKCIPSFKDYVTEYTVLSIFNMLCSSWTASKDDLKNFVCENNCKHERDSRKCLMDSYAMILATYLGTDYNNTTGIMTLCDKHYCSFSYSTEYITANEFEEKYSSTCRWDGQFPVARTLCDNLHNC